MNKITNFLTKISNLQNIAQNFHQIPPFQMNLNLHLVLISSYRDVYWTMSSFPRGFDSLLSTQLPLPPYKWACSFSCRILYSCIASILSLSDSSPLLRGTMPKYIFYLCTFFYKFSSFFSKYASHSCVLMKSCLSPTLYSSPHSPQLSFRLVQVLLCPSRSCLSTRVSRQNGHISRLYGHIWKCSSYEFSICRLCR